MTATKVSYRRGNASLTHTVGEDGVKRIEVDNSIYYPTCTVIFDDGHHEKIYSIEVVVWEENK